MTAATHAVVNATIAGADASAPPTVADGDLEPGDALTLLLVPLDGATAVQLHRLLGALRGATPQLGELHLTLDRALRTVVPDLAAYRTRLDPALTAEGLALPDPLADHVLVRSEGRYVHRASAPGRRALARDDVTDRDRPLGVLVRRYRADAGLTQAQLAAAAQVSPRCVQHVESGTTKPRADTVRRLVRALDPADVDREVLLAAARRAARAPRRNRDVRRYADRVPTNRITAVPPRWRANATGDASDRYARPAELSNPPADDSASRAAVFAWLEPVPSLDAPVDGAASTDPVAYDVCQAWATTGDDRDDGHAAWHVQVLAAAVEPLAGALLVEGLRALRRAGRTDPAAT